MKTRDLNNYVVVGGGTAGLLTALYIRQIAPKKKVTVLKSDAIGIVGAGEGTTPGFVQLLDFLSIPVSRLVREAGATIKNGIRFVNWNGGGDSDAYMHPFDAENGAGISDLEPREMLNYVHPGFLMAANLDLNVDDAELLSKLRTGAIAAIEQPFEVTNMDPIVKYQPLSQFAVHFDAVSLANELTVIAKSRNIEFVEGILESSEQDETGDVKTLILESGERLEADFIFDASGFKSFFPRELGSEWVSHKEYLPVDAAIPFSLPAEEKLPAYTDAIAMKYGWMWKIPLQHRYGCGYAFDSSLITAEEAQAEVEEYLGHEIEVNRTLQFEPGYYKDPWKHNVIAVGLAAGFVEPLEATSITSLVAQLMNVLSSPDQMATRDPRAADLYNKQFTSMNEEIAALINFHYLTDREDTEFWKRFKADSVVPSLADKLDIMEYRAIGNRDISDPFWSHVSWYYVGFGIKYQPLLEATKKASDHTIYTKFHGTEYEEVKSNVERLVEHCVDHRDFLTVLGAKKWES
jgi:tryptophan halogenase